MHETEGTDPTLHHVGAGGAGCPKYVVLDAAVGGAQKKSPTIFPKILRTANRKVETPSRPPMPQKSRPDLVSRSSGVHDWLLL